MAERSTRDFSQPKPELLVRPDQRPELGFAGAQEKNELDNQIAALEDRLNSLEAGGIDTADLSAEMNAERIDVKNELQEKQLELEVFLLEHDNAGAFKMKRFNEGFMNMFEEGQLTIAEDGTLELDPSEVNRRMAVVNVGELARFNKEGKSHEAGNQILNEAVEVIENQVLDKLKELGKEDVPYSIYRFSGNEYMVDIQDISSNDMKRLTASIAGERPTIDKEKYPGVTDPAPLTAAQTGFSEMVDVYNTSWNRLTEREAGPDKMPVPNEKTIRRDAYGMMKDIANYELDVEKFASRAARVQDIIDRHGVDGEETVAFFDNYMKKMFAESELDDLDKFVGLSDLEVYNHAFEWASKMSGQAKELDSMLDEMAENFVQRVLERRRQVELPEQFIYASGEEVPLATIPERTKGQEQLAEAQALEDAAEENFKKNKQDAELKHEWAMAKLENRKVKARHDQGTGLLERGVYYGELTEALKDGDKESSVLFVDMGFLKYFDHAGGRDVGDNALKMAADLMEKAVTEAGVEGTVYRYGGDEFTIRIDGGEGEVTKFNRKLNELKSQAGAIPAGRRGHEGGYYPTPLEFNAGAVDTADLEKALDKLEQANLLKEDERSDPKRQAEIMTTLADKMIEAQKAVQRFGLLINQLQDDRYWSEDGNEDFKQHVDKLIEFSDKGIFGERGGRDALMSWAQAQRGGADQAELTSEIQTWVGEQIAKGQENQSEKKATEDTIIEQMVRDAFGAQIDQAAAKVKQQEDTERKTVEDEAAMDRARGEIQEL